MQGSTVCLATSKQGAQFALTMFEVRHSTQFALSQSITMSMSMSGFSAASGVSWLTSGSSASGQANWPKLTRDHGKSETKISRIICEKRNNY